LRKCRASGGKNKADGSDNGLSVKDMERYLDEFDRYDSVWDTKPAWYVFMPELLRLASLKVERRGEELFFFGKLQDLSCIQDCDKLSNKSRASSALNAVIYTFSDAKLPSQGEYARAFLSSCIFIC